MSDNNQYQPVDITGPAPIQPPQATTIAPEGYAGPYVKVDLGDLWRELEIRRIVREELQKLIPDIAREVAGQLASEMRRTGR